MGHEHFKSKHGSFEGWFKNRNGMFEERFDKVAIRNAS